LSALCTDRLNLQGDTLGTHLFYGLNRCHGLKAAGSIQSMKNHNNLIGNRIRDLSAF